MSKSFIAVSQDVETPTSWITSSSFKLRYAYARAADCQKNGAPGQDYLCFSHDADTVVFALCDGVSQSFYGDLAAMFLGNYLLGWLADAGKKAATAEDLQVYLASKFTGVVAESQKRVSEYILPENLAPIVAQVLEKKRAMGSESTFIGGRIDFKEGNLKLAWGGDSRLRLWGKGNEVTDTYLPKDSFRTMERWSTHKGVVGRFHTCVLPLRVIDRILAYSDGFSRLDAISHLMPQDSAIDMLMHEATQEPSSDDISFMEVVMNSVPKPRAQRASAPSQPLLHLDSNEIALGWQGVPGCEHYEIEYSSENGRRHWLTKTDSWRLPFSLLPGLAGAFRIRPWVSGEPGEWSPQLNFSLAGQGATHSLQASETPAPMEQFPEQVVSNGHRLEARLVALAVVLGVITGLICSALLR
ncbi:MAG: protein phosphatase 2C domain-containing protein [Anaerolineales bacterium]|nr:protein phosphatase 2C domain-containing protein [Anaerolineales bacterium]